MNNSNNVPNGQQNPTPQTLLTQSQAIENYRLSQLYNYAMAAERLRCTQISSSSPPQNPTPHFQNHAISQTPFRPDMSSFFSYCRIDPRIALCRAPDEPKPQHSYIGLIAMAILSSSDQKLVLSDIYNHILENYPYFRSRGPGWRNSIRHNLSLNECFRKAGRSPNGKGHFWEIHPANMEDFTKGDFRRRKAQRKVRRAQGLSVDEEDSPSPPPSSPPPVNWPDHPHPHSLIPPPHHHHLHQAAMAHFLQNSPYHISQGMSFPLGVPPSAAHLAFQNSLFSRHLRDSSRSAPPTPSDLISNTPLSLAMNLNSNLGENYRQNRKRQFDVASLLAPETGKNIAPLSPSCTTKSGRSEESNSPGIKIKKVDSEESDQDSHLSDEESEEGRRHCGKKRKKESSYDDNDNEEGKIFESPKDIKLSSSSSSSPLLVHHSFTPPTCSPESSSGFRIENLNSKNLERNGSGGGNRQNFGQHFTQGPLPIVPPQIPLNFHANPNLFQNNPSLASLMILSSRYRELHSSIINPLIPNINKRSS